MFLENIDKLPCHSDATLAGNRIRLTKSQGFEKKPALHDSQQQGKQPWIYPTESHTEKKTVSIKSDEVMDFLFVDGPGGTTQIRVHSGKEMSYNNRIIFIQPLSGYGAFTILHIFFNSSKFYYVALAYCYATPVHKRHDIRSVKMSKQ